MAMPRRGSCCGAAGSSADQRTAGKVAFLYTGQGSQYVNMLADLRSAEPVVAATFDEADEVMTPAPRTTADRRDLRRSGADPSRSRRPKTTSGGPRSPNRRCSPSTSPSPACSPSTASRPTWSWATASASTARSSRPASLTFAAALEAVSARGQEMANLVVEDTGLMVAVSAPLEMVEEIVASIDGNVVVANVNSTTQVGDRRGHGARCSRPSRPARREGS